MFLLLTLNMQLPTGLLNIKDGAFAKIIERFSAINYFCKNLSLRLLIGFWARFCRLNWDNQKEPFRNIFGKLAFLNNHKQGKKCHVFKKRMIPSGNWWVSQTTAERFKISNGLVSYPESWHTGIFIFCVPRWNWRAPTIVGGLLEIFF